MTRVLSSAPLHNGREFFVESALGAQWVYHLILKIQPIDCITH